MDEWHPWRVAADSRINRWDCHDCNSNGSAPGEIEQGAENHITATGHTVTITHSHTRTLKKVPVG